MRPSYDVVVVGAGPGGSTAARLAAEAGLSALLIDKHQEIGAPVRCAEAVGADATRPYIDLEERWINARISAYAIHNARGASVRVPPTEPTLVVERKIFDRALAERAARAGADVFAKTTATGLVREGGRIAGVEVERQGQTRALSAKLVIAADGSESQLARWAGLKTIPAMRDYFIGLEYLVAAHGAPLDMTVCEYHVAPSIAPGGYAWVFPKGPTTANVGLVVTADRASDGAARVCLDRFVSRRFPGASILSEIAGGIPATGALKAMVTDGLMAVGDAAHQADPLTAGGINLAMFAADMAVQTGAQAIRAGDVSASALRPYETAWRARFGRQHNALYRLRQLVTAMDEDDCNGLIGDLAAQAARGGNPLAALTTLLRRKPLMLAEVAVLLATGVNLK